MILVLSLLPLCASAQNKTELWLYLRPRDPSYEVTPGETNTFYLDVSNFGTTNINNLVFSSDSPEGWTVDFYPGRLNMLAAGSTQTVDVNIVPPSYAKRGRYSIAATADSNEIRRVTNIEVEIKGISEWLWVGIGVAVVVVGGFIFIFLRMGRRG